MGPLSNDLPHKPIQTRRSIQLNTAGEQIRHLRQQHVSKQWPTSSVSSLCKIIILVFDQHKHLSTLQHVTHAKQWKTGPHRTSFNGEPEIQSSCSVFSLQNMWTFLIRLLMSLIPRKTQMTHLINPFSVVSGVSLMSWYYTYCTTSGHQGAGSLSPVKHTGQGVKRWAIECRY